MDKNTRVLSLISLLIIILGVLLIWFGFKDNTVTTTKTVTISTSSAVIGVQGQNVKITKVIDGDTIQIEGDQTVRLLGIDTPETVDPRRPVGCFGKEASRETKDLLESKEVILKKDVSETDKYGRLLRYVYLPIDEGKLFVNDYLIREGFAKMLTYPPDVKFSDQLLAAQTQAKEGKKGLWGRCPL